MMTMNLLINQSKLKVISSVEHLSQHQELNLMSPSKVTLTKHIRALHHLIESYSCCPATIIGTVLRTWCKSAFPALQKSSLPYLTALDTEPDVMTFVHDLLQLEFLDAAYWLSSAYTMLNEEKYRKKLAMFFTPPSLTHWLLNDLSEQGIEFDNQSFFDPACGGAAFLVPIAMRMRHALLKKKLSPLKLLKHIETHLYGTDLDITLCKLSKHFLCMALHNEVQKTGYRPNFQIHNANSLTCLKSKFGKVDVIVCNPPYRKMLAEELLPLEGLYDDIVEGHPNLYGLFTKLCVQLLRVGGYAALVTPTSFLSGQNFSLLRKFLLNQTDILHIGMVSERHGVFIDVDQETALTVLQKRIEKPQTQFETKISVVSKDGEYKSVGKCLIPNSSLAWPIPRKIEDIVILEAASLSPFRLSDYGYRIRIGAYVWNRDKRPKFESALAAKRAKAHSAMPLLWSRDISTDRTLKLEDLSKISGKPRYVDFGAKTHSSVVTAPSVVMQRVTSNDQPRRLVAAAVSNDMLKMHGGFIGENHIVILEQVISKPAISPKNLAKLLSTAVIDRSFRCISGATNVSVFELNQLALPDPQILKTALANGCSMDAAVNQGFGLSF